MDYSSHFWKKNWDKGLKDIEPSEYDTTFVQMIEKTFTTDLNALALTYLGITMTYGELNDHANRFANILLEQGFKKGDIVAVCMPNTPQYLIALVGTLRIGGLISGLSPLLPPNQMEYQINDLSGGGKKVALVTLDSIFANSVVGIADKTPGLKLVITTNPASFLPKIKQTLGKLLKKIPTGKVVPLPGKTILDFHKDILKKSSANQVQVDIMPDDLCAIQYTGGTTGPPKGAMIKHRNVAHNIQAMSRWFGWSERKGIMLSGFPMFHTAGITVAETSLFLGWPQVIIPNPRDTDHICSAMEKYQPTDMVNVPSLYQILMDNPRFSTLDHSNLRICVYGASPFPVTSQEKFEGIVGKGKLLGIYGMTEMTAGAAVTPVEGKKKLDSVGLPLLNTEIKIVSTDSTETVPVGEAGEILIKGPSVMYGYYNNPEATQKTIDEDGFLRTGDVGIMDKDGYIRIVDRTKDMIIVGGYKVYSNKVENILSAHPGIESIALIGIANPERPGSELVKAVVQKNKVYEHANDTDMLKKEILKFAKENCSAYEIPKEIEFVEEIPLTPAGKLDKKLMRLKN